MSKRTLIISTVIVLICLLGFFAQIHVKIASIFFSTCNETSDSSWGIELQQCDCRGFTFDVTPGVPDYYKDVCIGIINKN